LYFNDGGIHYVFIIIIIIIINTVISVIVVIVVIIIINFSGYQAPEVLNDQPFPNFNNRIVNLNFLFLFFFNIQIFI
jgi:hypothetical protein